MQLLARAHIPRVYPRPYTRNLEKMTPAQQQKDQKRTYPTQKPFTRCRVTSQYKEQCNTRHNILRCWHIKWLPRRCLIRKIEQSIGRRIPGRRSSGLRLRNHASKAAKHDAHEHGRLHDATSVTGQFTLSLVETGLKLPWRSSTT